MIEHTQTLPSLQENRVISRLNRKEWIEKDGEDLPQNSKLEMAGGNRVISPLRFARHDRFGVLSYQASVIPDSIGEPGCFLRS